MRRIVIELSDEFIEKAIEEQGFDSEGEAVDEMIESLNDFIGLEEAVVIFEEVEED